VSRCGLRTASKNAIYVVGPRIKPGGEWFFNLARRHPREGDERSLEETHILCYKKEGIKEHKNMHRPDIFARLRFE
jgi:hypothetical protein